MDMTFRAMIPAERNYTYSQSQQISMQTGLVGHLRGDMDRDGNGFFTSWDDFRKDLKTDEFKTEFDDVINALRFDEQYGGILKNRSSLTRYCYEHADGGFDGNYCKEFGFRADTAQYAYLLRLNPSLSSPVTPSSVRRRYLMNLLMPLSKQSMCFPTSVWKYTGSSKTFSMKSSPFDYARRFREESKTTLGVLLLNLIFF